MEGPWANLDTEVDASGFASEQLRRQLMLEHHALQRDFAATRLRAQDLAFFLEDEQEANEALHAQLLHQDAQVEALQAQVVDVTAQKDEAIDEAEELRLAEDHASNLRDDAITACEAAELERDDAYHASHAVRAERDEAIQAHTEVSATLTVRDSALAEVRSQLAAACCERDCLLDELASARSEPLAMRNHTHKNVAAASPEHADATEATTDALAQCLAASGMCALSRLCESSHMHA